MPIFARNTPADRGVSFHMDRKFADECERLAQQATKDRHRAVLPEMAQAWRQLWDTVKGNQVRNASLRLRGVLTRFGEAKPDLRPMHGARLGCSHVNRVFFGRSLHATSRPKPPEGARRRAPGCVPRGACGITVRRHGFTKLLPIRCRRASEGTKNLPRMEKLGAVGVQTNNPPDRRGLLTARRHAPVALRQNETYAAGIGAQNPMNRAEP